MRHHPVLQKEVVGFTNMVAENSEAVWKCLDFGREATHSRWSQNSERLLRQGCRHAFYLACRCDWKT